MHKKITITSPIFEPPTEDSPAMLLAIPGQTCTVLDVMENGDMLVNPVYGTDYVNWIIFKNDPWEWEEPQ